MTGQQWLENRTPDKHVVASHLVNLAWNGMAHLVVEPSLLMDRVDRRRRETDAEDQDGAEASRSRRK